MKTDHSPFAPQVTDKRPLTRTSRIRLERAARMKRVTTALNNGLTVEQIAQAEAVKTEAIARFLRASGVVYPGAGAGNSSLFVRVRKVALPALDRLAAKWRCDRSEAAAILLAASLKNNAVIGEKIGAGRVRVAK